MNTSGKSAPPAYDWTALHMAALLGANVALALGAWFVRLADSGPVSAGFWRMFLPLPLLFALALWSRQPLVAGLVRWQWLAVAGAGVIFALDIASWHLGIGLTRLGNATLFGNSGSLIIMAWGVIALRRAPSRFELAAFAAAITGSAVLMGRSLEIARETLVGDLFCLLAGFFYAFYIILLQNARARMGSWSLLAWSSLASAPVLLLIALLLEEPVLPSDWTPLIGLALCSQVIGQGLLVFAMRHFPPFVLGLAMLTQPVVAVAVGWLAFGEALVPLDALGMALIGTGMVLVGRQKGNG